MSLAESYAEACTPDRWSIAGIRLQPLSWGHILLLQRTGSAYLSGGRITPPELVMGLYICSAPASSQILSWRSCMPLTWRMRSSRMMISSVVWPERFRSRATAFAAYLTAGHRRPKLWANERPDAKAATGPGILMAHQRLMRIGFSDSEAWDLPMERCEWESGAYCEREGLVSFFSESDARAAEANTVTA